MRDIGRLNKTGTSIRNPKFYNDGEIRTKTLKKTLLKVAERCNLFSKSNQFYNQVYI